MRKERVIVWMALGAIAALFLFLPTENHGPRLWMVGAGVFALQQLAYFAWRRPWTRVLLAVRRRPNRLWSALLVVLTSGLGAWIARVQPVWGRWPDAEQAGLLVVLAWIAWTPFTVVDEHAPPRGRLTRTGRFLLATTATVATLFAIEAFLRVFFVRSDGFAVTAMHRAWMELHWKPINSLRYRDLEPVSGAGLHHVLVVGDSFATGHGIEDVEQSFPHVLERGLGPSWRVNIAARPGWSTDAEFAGLVSYPVRPDVIVLSYYINDMRYLLPKVEGPAPLPRGIAWLVDDFFTTSYVYWHVLHGLGVKHDDYARDQLAAYDDPVLWPRHAADLLRFDALAREQDVKLVVLVWPRLDGVEGSRGATSKVKALFRDRGVDVVDLTDEFAPLRVDQLVLGRLDAHPNATVHALVGQRLLEHVARP